MQQVINPKIGYRMLSNPFHCSPAGAFIPKVNSIKPSVVVINDLFTYEIMNQDHFSPKVMEKSTKASIMLFSLIQKHYNLFWYFFSSCIGNLHLNILLILDDFSITPWSFVIYKDNCKFMDSSKNWRKLQEIRKYTIE